jgi:hypothetical protein
LRRPDTGEVGRGSWRRSPTSASSLVDIAGRARCCAKRSQWPRGCIRGVQQARLAILEALTPTQKVGVIRRTGGLGWWLAPSPSW